MKEVEWLRAIEEIRHLKGTYFRYVDLKRWHDLAGLFTEDAVLEFPEIAPEPYDLDGAIAMISEVLDGCTTIHHGHTPEITVMGPDTAHGIWAMEDILIWDQAAQDRVGRSRTQGWGHYHETYRRVGVDWRIASLRLSRLCVQSALPMDRFD